jgi:membrane protein DedA with SNARE-associated domain
LPISKAETQEMSEAMTALLSDHVAWALFLWVLGNQAGAPVPVGPALLAAGALAHSNFDLMTTVTVVVGAALCADLAWYSVGRWRGAQVLGRLRLRFEWLSTRIDRATNLSTAHEVVFLVGARFLPELNPLAAGLAGATRATIGRFLPCAVGSALIWAGTWTGLGYVLGAAIAGYRA